MRSDEEDRDYIAYFVTSSQYIDFYESCVHLCKIENCTVYGI